MQPRGRRRELDSMTMCSEHLREWLSSCSENTPTGKAPHACQRYLIRHFIEKAWRLGVPPTTEMLYATSLLPRHILTSQTPSLVKIFHSPRCSTHSTIRVTVAHIKRNTHTYIYIYLRKLSYSFISFLMENQSKENYLLEL